VTFLQGETRVTASSATQDLQEAMTAPAMRADLEEHNFKQKQAELHRRIIQV
jgi:hypothetical protein